MSIGHRVGYRPAPLAPRYSSWSHCSAHGVIRRSGSFRRPDLKSGHDAKCLEQRRSDAPIQGAGRRSCGIPTNRRRAGAGDQRDWSANRCSAGRAGRRSKQWRRRRSAALQPSHPLPREGVAGRPPEAAARHLVVGFAPIGRWIGRAMQPPGARHRAADCVAKRSCPLASAASSLRRHSSGEPSAAKSTKALVSSWLGMPLTALQRQRPVTAPAARPQIGR